MKLSIALAFLFVSSVASETRLLKGKNGRKKNAVCVVGCTPYVNPNDENAGILKWLKLVDEMAEECDVMVHVGDTKAGAAVCNKDLMVRYDIHFILQLLF